MIKIEKLKHIIYEEDETLKEVEIGAEACEVVELLSKVKEMTPKEVEDRYEAIVIAIDYCQASRNDPMANLLDLVELGIEAEKYLNSLIWDIGECLYGSSIST